MVNGIRTGDPRGFNKGRSSKFRVGSRDRQTPEESWRTYRPKHYENYNKDEDNSSKTYYDKNHQASSQKFRHRYSPIVQNCSLTIRCCLCYILMIKIVESIEYSFIDYYSQVHSDLKCYYNLGSHLWVKKIFRLCHIKKDLKKILHKKYKYESTIKAIL